MGIQLHVAKFVGLLTQFRLAKFHPQARKIRVELYMLRIENPAEYDETMLTLKASSRLSSDGSQLSFLRIGWKRI